MEKYAVVQNVEEETDKTASTKKVRHCPKCGEECTEVGGQLTLWCPVCGTSPWEKKEAP